MPYRASRNRIYVWAAPCPTCGVGKDKPCRSIAKGSTRLLFGRRTHPERRQKVREMGNPKVHPTRATLRYAPGDAIRFTQEANTFSLTRSFPTPIYTTGTAITGAYTTGGLVTVGNITTSTTAGWTVTRDEMWNSWVANQTTATGSTIRWEWTDEQRVVWGQWNRAFYNVGEAARQAALPAQEAIRVMNDEIQRQREARNRELLARQQERAELAKVAAETAEELFTSLLSDEQLADWLTRREVTVRGSEGGLYRIHDGGVHGNIAQIDEHGCRLATLCVAPRMYDEESRAPLPTADGWVGQLLAIRFNERELREKANFSYRRGCQHPDVPVIGAGQAA